MVTRILLSSLLFPLGPARQSPPGPPPAASPAPARAEAPPSSLSPSPSAPAPASGPAPAADDGGAGRAWTFDADRVDAPPAGFTLARTGPGRAGRWLVRADPTAPSPGNVLAQLDDDDTDGRFPLALADGPPLQDVRVSMRCKAVSGRVDQACGVVARVQGPDDYYVTRANALEGNVRLYVVQHGRRQQLASWRGPVTSGAWHALGLQVEGDHLQVFWDGAAVVDQHDGTISGAGGVGVWTKADSVTLFDDLRAEVP